MSWLAEHGEAITVAAIGLIGVVAAAWIAARKTRADVTASAQRTINEGWEGLMDDLREERRAWKDEATELRGEVRALSQHIISLENLLRRGGIDIPFRPAIVAGTDFAV